MILRRHPSTVEDKYASLIDMTCIDSRGKILITETMHIDCLADLGLPDEAKYELEHNLIVEVSFIMGSEK